MSRATTEEPRLLSLIHSLLNRQKAHERRKRARHKEPGDRRDSGRQGYYCWQLAAFYDGKRLPQQVDFKLVHCRDLSPQGFSFYHESPPRLKRLIVALGTPPFKFFEAELVRREPAHRERENGWILGCRFTKQLRPRAGDVD